MSLINSVVQFSDDKAVGYGVVLDQILMQNAANSPTVVTGYIIKTSAGKIKHIQHWRIQEVLQSEEEKQQQQEEQDRNDPFNQFVSGKDVYQAMGIQPNPPSNANLFDDDDEDDDLPF